MLAPQPPAITRADARCWRRPYLCPSLQRTCDRISRAVAADNPLNVKRRLGNRLWFSWVFVVPFAGRRPVNIGSQPRPVRSPRQRKAMRDRAGLFGRLGPKRSCGLSGMRQGEQVATRQRRRIPLDRTTWSAILEMVRRFAHGPRCPLGRSPLFDPGVASTPP